MKLLIKVIAMGFLLQFSIGITPVLAQVTEHYFSDAESKDGSASCHIKYNNSIIVGGQSFDRYRHQPVVMRVDTTGNVLWKTSDTDTAFYTGVYQRIWKLMDGNNGFVYALCGSSTYNYNSVEWWKINPASGVVIWKKKINGLTLDSYSQFHLVDYDASSFIVVFKPTMNQMKIAFIAKSTGDTLSTKVLFNGSVDYFKFGICIDAQKNIYYSKGDTICKRLASNLDSIAWAVQYPLAAVEYYSHLYHDSTTTGLYCIGNANTVNDNGKIVKINPLNGSWVSTYTTAGWLQRCYDIKVHGPDVYVMWESIVTDQGYFLSVTKYEMATATEKWHCSYVVTGVGTPVDPNYDEQHSNSLDIDDQGDVYATGIYAKATTKGTWCVVKVDGVSGIPVYEKTIALDTSIQDVASSGRVACVINNKMYFIGELETQYYNSTSGHSTLAFVELNQNSGNVISLEYLGGNYQFPSKTLQIEPYLSNQTLVMKQVGRKVKLEMYDYNKNVIWEEEIMGYYFLNGGQATVSPTGDIYMTAYLRGPEPETPFYDNQVDSIIVYKLNGSGNILNTYGFYVGISDAFPVEIHADSVNALLFYQKDDSVYCRKIIPTSISAEYNAHIKHHDHPSGSKLCFNANASFAYLFGRKSSGAKVIEINKSTMAMTDVFSFNLQHLLIPNYVRGLNSNTVLVAGNGNAATEALLIYDIGAQDTIWAKTYGFVPSPGIIKYALDDTQTYLYLISRTSLATKIKKVKVLDGSQVWEYIYTGTVGTYNNPLDISLDNQLSQLIVSGIEYNSTTNWLEALTLVLDTSGNALDTLIYSGEFAGDNYALCTQVLPDGTHWIGGNLNKNAYGLAGFIMKKIPCTTSFNTINALGCGTYNSPSGNYTWNINGTYTDTISSVGGCDSILTINLTIIPPVTVTITATGSTTFCQGDSVLLSGTPGFVSYQWYNRTFLIPGATQANYYAKNRGRFTCIASDGICSDTSNIIQVYVPCVPLGPNHNRELETGDQDEQLLVYPNPGRGQFSVESVPGQLKIYNCTGQLIYSKKTTNNSHTIDLSEYPDGLYSFTLEAENRFQINKVLLIR